MRKLIELFNEYERPQTNHIYTAYEVKENMNRLDILQEFIKWLVDNDKIDKEKFNYCRDNFFDERYFGYWTHEYIIMMLARQDKPIEFLCSILK